MITIRKYKQEDKEFVRKICMDTAKGSFAVKPKKREAVAKMYIDYNINYEPENCFVAVDEDGTVCGYCSYACDMDKLKNAINKHNQEVINSGFKNDCFVIDPDNLYKDIHLSDCAWGGFILLSDGSWLKLNMKYDSHLDKKYIGIDRKYPLNLDHIPDSNFKVTIYLNVYGFSKVPLPPVYIASSVIIITGLM